MKRSGISSGVVMMRLTKPGLVSQAAIIGYVTAKERSLQQTGVSYE